MREALQLAFLVMEKGWHTEREGSEIATEQTINRLEMGETVIFVYPWASPDKVDKIMRETGAVGQFDLPFHGDSLLHVSTKNTGT